ncbi:hypothetical protein JTE90_013683 [Oedothorax gibbosus]|uniref:Sorbin and SH3 domain-containing protein 1 n=1 Tax=Oedothorax gibbosus TaxID=931172 RepID=A0AAV6VE99_9ARAC|nr:hypothetical protein JTE90_013683 [Oedothorax gibbosus]
MLISGQQPVGPTFKATAANAVWSPNTKKRANLHLNLKNNNNNLDEVPSSNTATSTQATSTVTRSVKMSTTTSSNKVTSVQADQDEKSPVWQPFGAPYDGPPQFRPVKLEFSPIKVSRTAKALNETQHKEETISKEAKPESPKPKSPKPPKETIESPTQISTEKTPEVHNDEESHLAHSSSATFTKTGWSSHLPPSQSPTVTLLQKAREGQLPKGAVYIEEKSESTPIPRNAVLIDQKVTVEGDKVHTDSYYAVPTVTTEVTTHDVKAPPKYDGIGPTEYGIPVGLRTGVKEEYASDWYKTMYKSLHRNKFPNDPNTTVHLGGYMSEPEYERKDKLRAKYEADHRRKPEKTVTYTSQATSNHQSVDKSRLAAESTIARHEPKREAYRVEPRSIADYEPGRSSLAEREFEKFWSDFWNSMDDLHEHLGHVSPRPHQQGLNRRWPNVLLSDGYESDSTLIRKTGRNPEVDPDQQKAWYKEIQKGGEIPLTGLRKTVPEKPTEFSNFRSELTAPIYGSNPPCYNHRHLPNITHRHESYTFRAKPLKHSTNSYFNNTMSAENKAPQPPTRISSSKRIAELILRNSNYISPQASYLCTSRNSIEDKSLPSVKNIGSGYPTEKTDDAPIHSRAPYLFTSVKTTENEILPSTENLYYGPIANEAGVRDEPNHSQLPFLSTSRNSLENCRNINGYNTNKSQSLPIKEIKEVNRQPVCESIYANNTHQNEISTGNINTHHNNQKYLSQSLQSLCPRHNLKEDFETELSKPYNDKTSVRNDNTCKSRSNNCVKYRSENSGILPSVSVNNLSNLISQSRQTIVGKTSIGHKPGDLSTSHYYLNSNVNTMNNNKAANKGHSPYNSESFEYAYQSPKICNGNSFTKCNNYKSSGNSLESIPYTHTRMISYLPPAVQILPVAPKVKPQIVHSVPQPNQKLTCTFDVNPLQMYLKKFGKLLPHEVDDSTSKKNLISKQLLNGCRETYSAKKIQPFFSDCGEMEKYNKILKTSIFDTYQESKSHISDKVTNLCNPMNNSNFPFNTNSKNTSSANSKTTSRVITDKYLPTKTVFSSCIPTNKSSNISLNQQNAMIYHEYITSTLKTSSKSRSFVKLRNFYSSLENLSSSACNGNLLNSCNSNRLHKLENLNISWRRVSCYQRWNKSQDRSLKIRHSSVEDLRQLYQNPNLNVSKSYHTTFEMSIQYKRLLYRVSVSSLVEKYNNLECFQKLRVEAKLSDLGTTYYKSFNLNKQSIPPLKLAYSSRQSTPAYNSCRYSFNEYSRHRPLTNPENAERTENTTQTKNEEDSQDAMPDVRSKVRFFEKSSYNKRRIKSPERNYTWKTNLKRNNTSCCDLRQIEENPQSNSHSDLFSYNYLPERALSCLDLSSMDLDSPPTGNLTHHCGMSSSSASMVSSEFTTKDSDIVSFVVRSGTVSRIKNQLESIEGADSFNHSCSQMKSKSSSVPHNLPFISSKKTMSNRNRPFFNKNLSSTSSLSGSVQNLIQKYETNVQKANTFPRNFVPKTKHQSFVNKNSNFICAKTHLGSKSYISESSFDLREISNYESSSNLEKQFVNNQTYLHNSFKRGNPLAQTSTRRRIQNLIARFESKPPFIPKSKTYSCSSTAVDVVGILSDLHTPASRTCRIDQEFTRTWTFPSTKKTSVCPYSSNDSLFSNYKPPSCNSTKAVACSLNEAHTSAMKTLSINQEFTRAWTLPNTKKTSVCPYSSNDSFISLHKTPNINSTKAIACSLNDAHTPTMKTWSINQECTRAWTLPNTENTSLCRYSSNASSIFSSDEGSDRISYFKKDFCNNKSFSPVPGGIMKAASQMYLFPRVKNSSPKPYRKFTDTNSLDRRTVSQHQYQEAQVNIHYKTPIRHLEKEYIDEDDFKKIQEDALRKLEEDRQKKHQQEMAELEMRRHSDNFTPSQKSPIPLNRYDNPFQTSYGSNTSTISYSRSPLPKTMARTLYPFRSQTTRELSLNKGDIVYINRQIDRNWFEGEHHGLVGIFPVSYVEIIPTEKANLQPRKAIEGEALVKYNFPAQSPMELSLFKGERVILLRKLDHNWYEGRLGTKKGIFPVSYIQVLREPQEHHATTGHRTISPKPTSPILSSLISDSPLKTHEIITYNTSLKPLHNKPPVQSENKSFSQTLHIDTYNEPIPYKSLYSYQPQNEDELELREGDTVYVMEKCDDGWYVGTSLRTGLFGTFPGNYVERM